MSRPCTDPDLSSETEFMPNRAYTICMQRLTYNIRSPHPRAVNKLLSRSLLSYYSAREHNNKQRCCVSINFSLSLSLSLARALSLPPSQRVSENLQRDDRVEVVHPQRVEGRGRGRGRGGGGGRSMHTPCMHTQTSLAPKADTSVLGGSRGRKSERASERERSVLGGS